MCEEAFRRTKAAPRPVCGEHFAGVPLRRVVLTGAPIQGGLGREWKNHSFGWSWGCCCSLKGFFTAFGCETVFLPFQKKSPATTRNCDFAFLCPTVCPKKVLLQSSLTNSTSSACSSVQNGFFTAFAFGCAKSHQVSSRPAPPSSPAKPPSSATPSAVTTLTAGWSGRLERAGKVLTTTSSSRSFWRLSTGSQLYQHGRWGYRRWFQLSPEFRQSNQQDQDGKIPTAGRCACLTASSGQFASGNGYLGSKKCADTSDRLLPAGRRGRSLSRLAQVARLPAPPAVLLPPTAGETVSATHPPVRSTPSRAWSACCST